jgi:hypothetical protein
MRVAALITAGMLTACSAKTDAADGARSIEPPPPESADVVVTATATATVTASAGDADARLQSRLARAARETNLDELRRGQPASGQPFGMLSKLGDPVAAPSTPPPPAPPLIAPASAAPSEASIGRLPIIVLDGLDIRVDGVAAGSVRPVFEAGRMRKLEELFSSMKRLRDDWKSEHPEQPFPGVVGIRVAPDTAMIVLKSLFQTTAFAGYPTLFVQSSADPSAIVELTAQIPGPPVAETLPAPPPEPKLRLRVSAGEVAFTWTIGSTKTSESKSPADASLSKAVCASWSANAIHRDPKDVRQDHLVVSAENNVTSRDLVQVAEWALACTRPYVDVRGVESERPAFWLQFAVN